MEVLTMKWNWNTSTKQHKLGKKEERIEKERKFCVFCYCRFKIKCPSSVPNPRSLQISQSTWPASKWGLKSHQLSAKRYNYYRLGGCWRRERQDQPKQLAFCKAWTWEDWAEHFLIHCSVWTSLIIGWLAPVMSWVGFITRSRTFLFEAVLFPNITVKSGHGYLVQSDCLSPQKVDGLMILSIRRFSSPVGCLRYALPQILRRGLTSSVISLI